MDSTSMSTMNKSGNLVDDSLLSSLFGELDIDVLYRQFPIYEDPMLHLFWFTTSGLRFRSVSLLIGYVCFGLIGIVHSLWDAKLQYSTSLIFIVWHHLLLCHANQVVFIHYFMTQALIEDFVFQNLRLSSFVDGESWCSTDFKFCLLTSWNSLRIVVSLSPTSPSLLISPSLYHLLSSFLSNYLYLYQILLALRHYRHLTADS